MTLRKKTITIALNQKEHRYLQILAERFSAAAITGRTAGQPSIRRLIIEIGQGRYALSTKASHGRRHPGPPHRRKHRIHSPGPISSHPIPPWWPRDPDGGIEAMLPVKNLPPHLREEAAALGLQEIDGDLHPHDSWWAE